MNSFLSSLELKRSENALYVCFTGIHEDYLTARYAEALEQFCQAMQGKPWARIVDLRQWSVTAVQNQKMIEQLLQQDLKRGLTLEYVLLPPDAVGRWQVEQTLKSLNSFTSSEVFHPTNDENEALDGLLKHGFSVNFGAVTRHESRCWKVPKTPETKS
ncbi:hypothetical protein [Rheinheimera sp. 1928-s]|uniref:hypothetical protein n=1 Tax=Rheinheimera sp. 1928-s TaxID=3033803 RepID=UPI002611F39E|nr:hypothetical protein [Rheinheimera sp. 1928-s]MDF3126453.1 hypothetical protein [Rheinheimera sp. 1928-s]